MINMVFLYASFMVLISLFNWFSREIFLWVCILPIVLLGIIICIAKINEVPGDSFICPGGYVELHISGKAKGNRYTFFELAMETIKFAQHRNKKVLFYTWIASEKKLKEIFEDAIIVKPISFYDYPVMILFSLWFTQKIKHPHPYIKCLIDTKKLPENFNFKRA